MGEVAKREGWSPRPALRRLHTLASEGLSRLALHGADRVGARPRVHGFPYVENLGEITIGDDLEMRAGPVPSHMVVGIHGVVRIGDGVTIDWGVGIAAEALVEIGDGAHIGSFVSILGSDFHVAGDAEAAATPAPIRIGEHAWIGDRVTILRGATIGRYARIEPGSVVSGVIPDGAHAGGVLARVIPREERGGGVFNRVVGGAGRPS